MDWPPNGGYSTGYSYQALVQAYKDLKNPPPPGFVAFVISNTRIETMKLLRRKAISPSKSSYISPPDGFKFVSELRRPPHLDGTGDLPLAGFVTRAHYAGTRDDPGQPVGRRSVRPSRLAMTNVVFWQVILVALTFSTAYLLFIDVRISVLELGREIQLEGEACGRRYVENNCAEPIEHIEELCRLWRLCVDRDPKDVSVMQIIANRIGLVVVSFTDSLSLKAI
ncbi:hypothetical protein PQX77_003644, partial [Marasmius sp. AFHP31]